MNKAFCFIAACIALVTVSCKKQSFLDAVAVTDLNEATVFADSARTMDFLANIYNGVDFSFSSRRFSDGGARTGMAAATDEAEGPVNLSDNTYLQFVNGTVNPSTIKDDVYKTCYQYVRAVNQLVAHIDTAKFSVSQRSRVKGEAIFLRGWYYFLLLKHYGGVPIVGDTIYQRNQPISTKRATFEQTVNYIVSQCDQAKALLSRQYNSLDFGRVTTGACQGLKSRVLLYAASPLYNDDGSIPGQTPVDMMAGENKALVGYYPKPSSDQAKARWRLALAAADSVMKMGYALNTTEGTDAPPGAGFYRTFTNKLSNELIFFRTVVGQSIEEDWSPPTRRGIANMQGTYPYQQMVDAFPMINGKDITDPTSGYKASDPYVNRDPRLNYTVIHNLTPKALYVGSGFSLQPVQIYFSSPTLDRIGLGTSTGYYTNKMLRDSTDANYLFSYGERAYPLIRYAEILLNWAEAKNEADGPSADVLQKLKDIRERAGIIAGSDGNYGLKPNMTQQEMRAAIQHERRIELAFEEHRFWDVRRWKIAPQTESKLMSGMQVQQQANGTYTYQLFSVRQHTFNPKTYLWAFPQHEISKPGGLVQNPGY
ncbi:RagB/SusD family nutrient uptake outer membrane protein [Mucilaginibacter limnophilus]|uniref:RagB/SusD family nutrient uptake outer membrane protein n=1 Tax=Mucilaginibacter limnophilus TaxID=1932778 RepID=A0A3S3TH92_9SPHI|nr:RagB/SusD family nutrient uptake outer membrane protein [Mucilaginibacter limnophilus]RVU00986.1 RagB/SusD family nutrient uptake outer membrane protein [Mucilaginibacter limnophilus]